MEERLQTENLSEETKNGVDLITVLNVIRRFWILLLATTLIGLGIGIAYAKIKDKPVYTATKSIMFITNVTKLDPATSGTSGSNSTNNATLAKKYLPDLAVYLTSDLFVKRADTAYKARYGEDAGSISAGSVSYSERSLIFSMSYSDVTEELAKAKLDVMIESSNETIQNADEEGSNIQGLIMGEDVRLKETQSYATVSVSTKTARIILLSTFLGILVGAAIVLLIYLTDNTVKSRYELENLTGGSVIAYIEDVKQ